jgi:hypothetical protein
MFLFCAGPFAAAAPRTDPSTVDPNYISALAVADHFLQAWQAGDVENGMALLSNRAKEQITADRLDNFLSPPIAAYEIGRGTRVKRGHYEFPVVLMGGGQPKEKRPKRRFSSIIVLHTGDNDWAVDKLP